MGESFVEFRPERLHPVAEDRRAYEGEGGRGVHAAQLAALREMALLVEDPGCQDLLRDPRQEIPGKGGVRENIQAVLDETASPCSFG